MNDAGVRQLAEPTHRIPADAAEPAPAPRPKKEPRRTAKKKPDEKPDEKPAPAPATETDGPTDSLAGARAALAAGRPRRAIALAQKVRHPGQRQRALALMTRAYCVMHNGHAARAVYRQLSRGARARVRGRCQRAGVVLE